MSELSFKFCVICGGKMVKPGRLSYAQWRSRRFCSNRCRVKGRRHPRPLCKCGCGRQVRYLTSEYLRGHRPCHPPYQSKRDGRWFIKDRRDCTVFWYRIVMENELGRLLRSDEHVHHRNGDPTDDRPENLEVLSLSEHTRVHMRALAESHNLERASEGERTG